MDGSKGMEQTNHVAKHNPTRDELKARLRERINGKQSARSRPSKKKQNKDTDDIVELASKMVESPDAVLDQLKVVDPNVRSAVKSMIANQAVDANNNTTLMNFVQGGPAAAPTTLAEAPPPTDS